MLKQLKGMTKFSKTISTFPKISVKTAEMVSKSTIYVPVVGRVE